MKKVLKKKSHKFIFLFCVCILYCLLLLLLLFIVIYYYLSLLFMIIIYLLFIIVIYFHYYFLLLLIIVISFFIIKDTEFIGMKFKGTSAKICKPYIEYMFLLLFRIHNNNFHH